MVTRARSNAGEVVGKGGDAAMSGNEPLDAGMPFPDDDGDDEVHALARESPRSVPGATELLAEGFVPLEELTGAMWVAEAWPEPHRRVLPETRPAMLTNPDDGRLWFVRSPWPTISPADVLSMVWAGRTRVDSSTMKSRIEVLWHAQALAILGLDEATATSFLRSLPHMQGWEISTW
ncbi:hypothetical protein acdb102_00120 [Acidothermaceae bacterium B102]|nr:hypothetical protein acdb102_00120 [Acidothermaceae bacterium B102]